MLNSQSAAFAASVWEIASRLGNNAPRIADDIMEEAFPLTCSQARQEGALRMLRTGIITEVKRILRNCSTCRPRSSTTTCASGCRQIRIEPAVLEAARHNLVATPKLRLLLDEKGSVLVARRHRRALRR
jgi:hypothetical protein